MIYLGYYEKFEHCNHIRIIAQGTKSDKQALHEVIHPCDMYYSKRYYHVIEAQNKTEAMNQLSRIARED